jgi:PglD N-terminal domain
MRVIVIGAGGHGRVVGDILRAIARTGQDLEFVGYLDDGIAAQSDAAVLGPLSPREYSSRWSGRGHWRQPHSRWPVGTST